MKNITQKQIEAAEVAAHLWQVLGDELLFSQLHGRLWCNIQSTRDWEFQLEMCHKMNLIAIGGK